MPIRYRPAEVTDIAALATIRASEWGTQAYWEARIGGYLAGEQSPQHALRGRGVFVAVDDRAAPGMEIVGFVGGHRSRRHGCDGELQWINVIEGRRGQGIAGALLAVIGAWFVEQAAFRVCVNAEAENIPARALYTKYGARALNSHWMIWEDIRQIGAGEPPGTSGKSRT